MAPSEKGQPDAIYVRYPHWLPTLHEHCMEYVLEGAAVDSVIALLSRAAWLTPKAA